MTIQPPKPVVDPDPREFPLHALAPFMIQHGYQYTVKSAQFFNDFSDPDSDIDDSSSSSSDEDEYDRSRAVVANRSSNSIDDNGGGNATKKADDVPAIADIPNISEVHVPAVQDQPFIPHRRRPLPQSIHDDDNHASASTTTAAATDANNTRTSPTIGSTSIFKSSLNNSDAAASMMSSLSIMLCRFSIVINIIGRSL